jgi:hypothetical protein
MKYAVQAGPGVMLYKQSFVKTALQIQKLIGGIHRQTDSMEIA